MTPNSTSCGQRRAISFVLTLAAALASSALGAATLVAPAWAAGRYAIDVYNPARAYAGTTIFADNTDPKNPVLVEVDMTGKVVWQHRVEQERGSAGGMDVEWIPSSDHILFTQRSGVYEIDRAGKTVWSHKAPSSHDADRLPNGNTLVVWGWGMDSAQPEVREVAPDGSVVWIWHAAQHLAGETRIFDYEGFTHTNSAVRLANGNTLISLRNYYMLVEVAPDGNIVWKLPGLYTTPHDPEILANGNILVNTRRPQVINEITPAGRIVWQYHPDQRDVNVIRYTHRLPNGNTIFVERTKIVEIAPDEEIVWQLRLTEVSPDDRDKNRWLYKGERIPADKKPEPAHLYAAPSETLKRSGEAMQPMEERNLDFARGSARAMMRKSDRNGDGRMARDEYAEPAPFEALDADADGFISFDEAVDFALKRLTERQTEEQPPARARKK